MKTLIEKYFELPLFTGTFEECKAEVSKLLRSKAPGRVLHYLNPHVFNLAWTDSEFRSCLRAACWLFPDGWGLVNAARRAGLQVADRLNVGDCLLPLVEQAANAKKAVFLWGGSSGVAEEAGLALKRQIPGLKIAGTRTGFFSAADEIAILKEIKKSRAGMVLLGMGSPKQEKLGFKLALQAPQVLVVSVGNALAFAAGRQRRAPRAFMVLKLEWLWRLWLEPGRMWKRYLVGNFLFLARVLSAGESRVN